VALSPYRRFLRRGPAGPVILTKSGAFLCILRLHPSDLESESSERRVRVCEALAQIFSTLGDGWGTWINVISRARRQYLERGALWHPTMVTVDEAQRRRFEDESANYERECFIALVYQPPAPHKQRLFDLAMGAGAEHSLNLEQQLLEFERQVSELAGALSGWVGLTSLSDEGEALAFLEECIDGIHQQRLSPPPGRLLDTLLGHEFIFGYRPTIDGRAIRVIALSEFPAESHSLMLSALGSLPLPYRFYVRLEHYDPTTANAKLAGYTRSWGNRLYGPLDAVHRILGGMPRENPHAAAMMEDVLAAQAENEHGDYRPVGYTAGFVLIGEDAVRVEAGERLIMREARNRGYGVRDETLNCADGYFGSWAANGYFNPRRAIINTLNAAHTLCLDIPWGGQERNPSPYYPANSPAMLIGLTRGNAPFGYCDHVDDRGHVLMPGPTGSGKTTAIGYTTLLHHRIAGAQSFNFDCGYGMYVPTLAVGGLHYDLGADTTCFQPLRHIDQPKERVFAHGWLSEDLLPFGGIKPVPERDEALWRALEVMAELPATLRTLTNLKYTVQDQTIREGLTFFTHEGPAGRYLDGDHDGLGESRFITFEIERLMGQGERVLVPVLSYLFHRIDQRLDGRPTRITADELWIMLARARFAAKFEDWLRTCRKKNAAVVLATQSLADIASSPLCAVILESCPTRLYLPNAEARSPQNAALYRSFGLADAQIEVIAAATPKRDYFYVSPRGRRLFSLALTPAALAFVGAGSPEDIIAARQMHQRRADRWAAQWLRHKGLPEWAEYWERIATEMSPGAGNTFPLEVTVPTDQRLREEVIWAED
jgi:type IV secretion system protein VirB4